MTGAYVPHQGSASFRHRNSWQQMESHSGGRRGCWDLTLLPPSSSSPHLFPCLCSSVAFLLLISSLLLPFSLSMLLKWFPLPHITWKHTLNTAACMLLSAIRLPNVSLFISQHKQASTSIWVMEAASICRGSDQQGGNGAPLSAWSQSDLWTLFALLSHKCLVGTFKAERIWDRSPLIWMHHSSFFLFFLSYSLLPLPTFRLNTDSPPSYANVLHDCRGLMQRTTKLHLPKSV